jgi:hypothetical protein
MTTFTFLLIIVFLIGLYFYAKTSNPKYAEGLTNNSNSSGQRCPDLLVQKGSRFYLYNTKLAEVPGVNPIEFENLEDYTEFLAWQKSQNISCPVLVLQSSFDTQGHEIYKLRPSVTDTQGGLNPLASPKVDAPNASTNLIQNHGQQQGQTQGQTQGQQQNTTATLQSSGVTEDSPSDKNNTNKKKKKTKKADDALSPDAMEENWGGTVFTQKAIDNGDFSGNYVPDTIYKPVVI